MWCLNERAGQRGNKFLKLFYKMENTTLIISILTCLSSGIMVLCGYCNLKFAISFGISLLGVSLILKLKLLLYGKLKEYKQKQNYFEPGSEKEKSKAVTKTIKK